MKPCGFLIIGFVGCVLAVGSNAKSVATVPGCEPEVLLACTKSLEYLNSDTALDLGASQQDLEKVCPTLQQGMKCINDYSNKCLPENIQTYFQSMYNGTISVISELCKPGDFQSEYLKHAPCMDKAKLEYKQCVDDYNLVMGSINPLQKDQRSTNIKIMCCSFSDYIKCSNMLVLKRCGDDTAKFTESLLDRLASPIIQEHCYRHFDGEKECSAIMSNVAVPSKPKLIGDDHDDHDHRSHGGQHVHGAPSGGPYDGTLGAGESEPTGNEIDRSEHTHGQQHAAAEPSTNSAMSTRGVWSFLASVATPLVVLLCVL